MGIKGITISLVLTVFSQITLAQSFGEGTYKSVGVYDTWEHSPFRTGELKGNTAVIANHLYNASGVNRTGHIVGIQRSRFGSNTFGVRINLNEPVSIGRQGKYVHALVYSPQITQVQVIGLGCRKDNTWEETRDVEQFWSDPVTVWPNVWTDVVVQVKTGEQAEVWSIIIVPDCQSPHELADDFVAYVDEVQVNTSHSRRTSVTSADDPYAPSSISIAEAASPTEKENVYTVSGQRVDNRSTKMKTGQLPKGIYIVGGKKMIKE